MGRKIQFAVLAMALVGALFWTGCSDTTSGGGQDARNNEKIVRYSYDCETVTCYDTSNIVDSSSNNSRIRTCIWNCGTGYEQSIRAQVTLKFEKIGAGCWQLTHDQLSGNYQGVCN